MEPSNSDYKNELWKQFLSKLQEEWGYYESFGKSLEDLREYGSRMKFAQEVRNQIKRAFEERGIDKDVVSRDTLHRYFQLNRISPNAKGSTLEVLCCYLGYLDWSHFRSMNKDNIIKGSSGIELESDLPPKPEGTEIYSWVSLLAPQHFFLIGALAIIGILIFTPFELLQYLIEYFLAVEPRIPIWILVIVLLGLALGFYLLLRKLRYYLRYYSAIPKFAEAFSFIHQLNSPTLTPNDINMTDDIDLLKMFCFSLASTYGEIIKGNCGVCIKVIGPKYIKTIARDRKSEINRREVIKYDKDNHIKHKWEDNTHFIYIFGEENFNSIARPYFLSSDLSLEENYQSSRLTEEDLPPPKGFHNKLNRQKKWPLPYKSTLVVPIVPLGTTSLENVRMEGYLCLDSRKTNAFDKNDAKILLGIADGIYPGIINFRDRHFENS